jgi:creatinine amidohydrolase
MPGIYLEHLTWPEAERSLNEFPVVLLPVGARLKEHGLHLPLNNDWLLAEYFTRRVLEQFPALALPTIQYGYYPAFVEYPGSINIARETFRETVCDICRSLAGHGGKRFYVLNTGISTNWALEPARLALEDAMITMEYTDLRTMLDDVVDTIREQEASTHADEIETSIMLFIHPEVVQMERARRDIDLRRRGGGLTRNKDAETGVYSPTGVWGDPTLATAEKGKIVVDAVVGRIVAFLREFAADDYRPATARDEYL